MYLRFKTRLIATLKVLKDLNYILRWTVWSASIMFVLQWLFAYKEVQFVWRNNGILEASKFMIDGFFSLFGSLNTLNLQLILAIAIIQGLTLSLLQFIRASQTSSSNKLTGSLSLAIFGSGCIACGGSIIAPLFSSFSSVAASQASYTVSQLVLLLSIILASFSLYQVSGVVATIVAKKRVRQ